MTKTRLPPPVIPEHRSLLARGRFVAAERELLASLRADPDQVTLHLDGVRLYHRLNEPERAAMHLGRARELTATAALADAGLLLRLAEALDHVAHRAFAEASAALVPLTANEAFSTAPDARLEALILAAESELELGNSFRAFKLAERVVAQPDGDVRPGPHAQAHTILARYYLAKGSADRAESAARAAIELAGGHELVELQAVAEGFLADLLRDRAGTDASRLARAGELHTAAATRLRALAADLPPERARSFLAQHAYAARLRDPGAPDRSPPLAIASGGSGGPGGPARAGSQGRLVATLSEMSLLIASMTELDVLLERVMDIAIKIVGAERGLVILAEPGAEELVVKVARNLDGESIVGIREFSHNVIKVATTGREVVTVDTANDDILSQHRSVSLYSIRSLVCFPLKLSDKIIGAVYLDNQKTVRVYTEEDLGFLRAFTNLAAIAIDRARLLGQLKEENVHLKRAASERFGSTNIIGSGPAMERVFRLVEKASDSAFPVLVTGATGTGKEVFTKAIHFGGLRKDHPFVAQNCAAIPSELLESEMFGYRRGAFTGANTDKKGLFETATGGTLFLDEIGELDLGLQAKLLRVLQDGKIRRVGDTAERSVDVRIISATNRDLNELVEHGRFRLDLYYRLNVIQIDLPTLGERIEDLPLLAQHFLEKSTKQMDKSIRGFTRRAIERLKQHDWPGNVRELENVVARAVVFAEGDLIDLDSLPALIAQTPVHDPPTRPTTPAETASPLARKLFDEVRAGGDFWATVKGPFLKRDVSRDVVREVIRLALEQTGWKYTRALKTLNLAEDDYRKFMNFLAKFGLKVEASK